MIQYRGLRLFPVRSCADRPSLWPGAGRCDALVGLPALGATRVPKGSRTGTRQRGPRGSGWHTPCPLHSGLPRSSPALHVLAAGLASPWGLEHLPPAWVAASAFRLARSSLHVTRADFAFWCKSCRRPSFLTQTPFRVVLRRQPGSWFCSVLSSRDCCLSTGRGRTWAPSLTGPRAAHVTSFSWAPCSSCGFSACCSCWFSEVSVRRAPSDCVKGWEGCQS